MGYLPDAFHAHFARDGEGHDVFGGVTIRYAVEDEPLGTAGAIRFAAEGVDERFVVCNGDVLTELDLGAMVRFHDERGAEATISLTQVDDPSAFGVVPTRPDGQVIAFVEKPPPGKAPSNWINAGTYVLEPAFLDRIPARLNVSIERETFPRMLSEPGGSTDSLPTATGSTSGRPRSTSQAHDDALAGRLGTPPAPGARETAPGVWMQGDVDVDPSAEIVAPVLLGAGARVEKGARVHASVVGATTVVEANAVIDRAVLHDGARVAPGSACADLDRRSGCRARGRTARSRPKRSSARASRSGAAATSPAIGCRPTRAPDAG